MGDLHLEECPHLAISIRDLTSRITRDSASVYALVEYLTGVLNTMMSSRGRESTFRHPVVASAT